MKRKTFPLIATSLLLTAFIFSSCKKDKDNTPAEQGLSFHLHTLVGNTVADFTSTFADETGRKFKINDCRYYISNIVLIKEDGTDYPLAGKVLLANPSTMSYDLGKVPVGKYKGFRFLMGIDSVTNHTDPASYPTTSPLSYQNPGMHWGWNSGYIFMLMEGKVDSTLLSNGVTDFDFFYHIGLDQMSRTIDFSNYAFEVKSSESYEIGLMFDLRKMLNHVDMRTEYGTHTMDNMPLALKIANNWTNSFETE